MTLLANIQEHRRQQLQTKPIYISTSRMWCDVCLFHKLLVFFLSTRRLRYLLLVANGTNLNTLAEMQVISMAGLASLTCKTNSPPKEIEIGLKKYK